VVETPPPPPKSYRMHIMLGLVVLALAETILIYMLIPSTERIKKDILDMQQVATNVDDRYKVTTDIKPDADLKTEPLVEKSLGDKFKVQSTRTDEQITDVFTVSIQVQILKKDETKYDKIYAERQYAVRDAVTVVLRASSVADRNQVSLTTIKREVMKAVNEVLGKTYVKGVLCIDPIAESN
jgi:hypothetical protein